MRVHVRDLPRQGLPADWRAKAWNLDHAWFREGELRMSLSLTHDADFAMASVWLERSER